MAQIVAGGHELGNHGAVHEHVEDMGKEELQQLIRSGEERIAEASGCPSVKAVCASVRGMDRRNRRYASEIGYLTVMWTADTVDWQLPPSDAIWKRALAGAENGALILMHPTEPTVAALPILIDGLRERGFTLTTVTDCISGKNDASGRVMPGTTTP